MGKLKLQILVSRAQFTSLPRNFYIIVVRAVVPPTSINFQASPYSQYMDYYEPSSPQTWCSEPPYTPPLPLWPYYCYSPTNGLIIDVNVSMPTYFMSHGERDRHRLPLPHDGCSWEFGHYSSFSRCSRRAVFLARTVSVGLGHLFFCICVFPQNFL